MTYKRDYKKVVSKKKIITINVPVWLIELINRLKDAGVIESRSEWCRMAIITHIRQFFDGYGNIIEKQLDPVDLDTEYYLTDPPGNHQLEELQKLVEDAKAGYFSKLAQNGGSLRK